MSAYKYDENIHHIDSIQFSVFANDVVKDYSSVTKDEFGIYLPESYENSEPKRGGLVDTRLGITDLNLECAYCGLKAKDCPGHFGHTELAEPVFHIGFFPIVKQILNCICLRSSRLLAHKYPEELAKIDRLYKSKKQFAEIRKLSSNIKISDVGVPVPKIKHEIKKGSGAITILAETNLSQVVSDDGDILENKPIIDVLIPSDVFNIFRNISNEDWRLLGFNPDLYRPEDLIISTFPIPPVAIRPSIRADFLASATYEDDLTHKLADIIKTNEKLRKQKEKQIVSGETKYGNDLHNFLQYHIATYFENDKDSFLTSEQKVGGKKFKSISERLKGKPGRIRGNLMGKRVNFSARSVITSDPNLKLHELGIPKKIAMEITFPEVVTAYNIERLTNLIRNGRYNYPGANFVIQGSSLGESSIREYDLRYRKKTMKLRYGDIVERHLINGDPVLFNRQPSLHKLSMMCHLANVIDDDSFNTFRLNVNVTPPYNADFDGDEMNMFAPQSIQTQIELFKIADVRRQIISPKDSKPIIGPVQDSVLGSYRMTHDNIRIDWHDYMNLVVYIQNNKNIQFNLDRTKFVKNKIYTGIDLFNNIIPNNINLKTGKVVLRNGHIINGPVNVRINNTIISNCWDRHGYETTQTYIDNIQRIITNWLLLDGFSVGLGDCYISQQNKEIIVKELEKKKLEINHLITEIENNPELMDADLFEASIQSNLSAQKGEIQKLVQDNIDSNNNFYIMVNSGSKGKAVNMMQIMGALGQDIFLFKRIQKLVNNRTLPHFFQDDDTPLSRGFIEHSYLDGLTPHEFFFHHMSGREGLIDTAIKTADTGYISRRLMKGLEDIGVKYDGTVRTGNNIILQYVYSDFNLDQIKQRKQTLYTMKMGDDEIKSNYTLSKKEINEISKKHKISENKISKNDNDYYEELLRLRDLLRHSQKMQYLNYRTIQSEFHLPINLARIILDNINNIYADDKNKEINPLYIIEKIDEILNYNITKLMCISEKNNNSIKIKDERICKLLFKYLLYEYLSPKKIIYEHKLTKYKLDLIFQQIVDGFKDSQVVAGEMVGCLAAQHIGEPSTQMSCKFETIFSCKVINKRTENISVYKGMIGPFIDDLMDKHKDSTLSTGHENSFETLLDNDENDYYIIGVDTKEKTKFNKISHVSRHPTNGDLMEIVTRSGRKITTTYSHNHLTRTEDSVVPILGKDLKIGHRIPVIKNIKQNNNIIDFVIIDNNIIKLDELFGWFIGAYLAEGSINHNTIVITSIKKTFQENTSAIADIFNTKAKIRSYKGEYGPGIDTSFNHKQLVEFLDENCKSGSFNKIIPAFAYAAPEEFTKGLLRGYFDGDGNVQCDKMHHCLRGCSRSEQLIKDLGLLYAYKGICVNYLVEENKRGSNLYHYIIPYKYIDLYYENIGTDDLTKLDSIMNLIEYNNRNNAHDKAEYIDKICGLGDLIAKCGKDLKLPGQSTTGLSGQAQPLGNYGRWKNKESIGRNTLGKYIKIFEKENESKCLVNREINILKQAYNSDVIWDEIIEINNIKDPKEYVYDFTVPGNETFLTGDGIIIHNTLNTFHATGSGSVGMQGVPRIEELIRHSRNIKTPIMTIYLDKEFQHNKEKASIIASDIQYTTVKDVIDGYDIIYDINTDTSGYSLLDKVKNPFFTNIKADSKNYGNMPWLLRIKINRSSLIETNVSLIDIKTSYIKFWKSFSSDLKGMKRQEKKIINSIISSCILSNYDNSESPIIHIRLDILEYDYNLLLEICDWIINNFHLKGIKNIDKIQNIDYALKVTFENKTHKFEETNEWLIITEGINMLDIRTLDGIDLNRTYCNDIQTIYKYFGIEAARSAVLKELNMVYGSSDVNYHHLSILVDVMTNNGKLISIDRHGISKLDTDPLARASFEMPIEHLIKAAMFCEVDHMKSVSSRIMAGRVISGGSGLCDILMDVDMIQNSEYIEDIESIHRSSFIGFEKNSIIDDIMTRQITEIFKPSTK